MKKRIVTLLIILATITLFGFSINAKSSEIKWEEIPFEYREYARILEVEYGVSECLILSLCWTESRLQVEAVNGNITQITNLKWFRDGIKATNVENPKTDWKDNMRVCAWYLSQWFELYEDPNIVIRGWNEGINPKAELITNYSETILNRSARWEQERDEYEMSFGNRSPYAIGEN